MKDPAKALLNDSILLAARERWFEKLTGLFNGKEPEYVIALDGVYGTAAKADPYREPEKWVEEALEALAGQTELLGDSTVFRPLCLEFGPYGVHFIDKMFGAEVFFDQDSKQWYSKYLNAPIGSLGYPDLDKEETWMLARRIAAAFLKQDAALPLFGLPTIASPLNVAVNLYGEEILVELCIDPDNALKDLKVINRLLCDLHKWYLDHIPPLQLQPVVSGHRTEPVGFGQICGCTTQLVSESMYRELIAPLDASLLSVYPNGGMIHLCGSHTQHIGTWRGMKPLRAVQINDRAAEDLKLYFEGLREDQIIYLNPCEGMTIEEALEITGGKRLVIVSAIEKPIRGKDN